MTDIILRLPDVLRVRGRSRSAHYDDIQQRLFTRPVLIGLRAVGWPGQEVAVLNAARIAGMNDDAIRALVVKLESSRKLAPERLASYSQIDTRPFLDPKQ